MGKHFKQFCQLELQYDICTCSETFFILSLHFCTVCCKRQNECSFMKCIVKIAFDMQFKILLVLLHFIPAEIFALYSSWQCQAPLSFVLGAATFGVVFFGWLVFGLFFFWNRPYVFLYGFLHVFGFSCFTHCLFSPKHCPATSQVSFPLYG